MTKFIVQPNSHIHLSDDDPFTLPLACFHILALVEPDPESWMVFPDDNKKFQTLLQTQYDLISEELDEDSEVFDLGSIVPEAKEKLVADSRMLWIGGAIEEDFPTYYQGLAEYYVGVTFGHDYEVYQDLRYYIRGVALDHPDWRVVVIGAMYEDDVMRVANAIQESGLDVTVPTRYCLSAAAFVNLDDVIELRSEMQRRGMTDDGLDDMVF